MRNFKELKIWQKGIDIAIKTYQLAGTFPKEDKFAVVQQMTRASVSIPQILRKAAAEKVRKIIQGSLKFPLAPHLNWRLKL